MTQPAGSGAPTPTTITPTINETQFEPPIIQPLDISLPPTPQQLADVAGNNAYFNNLNFGNFSLADGSVTTPKLADGAVTSVKIANGAVANIDLGPDTTRYSYLTNGGFEVWQRGTSFTNMAVNAYGPDGWYLSSSGGTFGCSQDTVNVDPNGSGAALSITYSFITDQAAFQQRIKDPPLIQQLRGRTVTLSMRGRCGPNGSLSISLQADTGPTVTSPVCPGGSVWSTMSVTITVPANAQYLDCRINVTNSFNAGQLQLDNAMLVIGPQYADYRPLTPADDLTRCLRYYEIIGTAGATDFAWTFYSANASAQFFLPVRFLVEKAVAPILTTVGTWSTINATLNGLQAPTLTGCRLSVTSVAAGVCQIANGAGCFFTVEANP